VWFTVNMVFPHEDWRHA